MKTPPTTPDGGREISRCTIQIDEIEWETEGALEPCSQPIEGSRRATRDRNIDVCARARRAAQHGTKKKRFSDAMLREDDRQLWERCLDPGAQGRARARGGSISP
jgi:hypothetical protein